MIQPQQPGYNSSRVYLELLADLPRETTSEDVELDLKALKNWLDRENQAYSNGDLAKPEDCYTQGLNPVSQNEKLRSCRKALMLCYSNRAATRIKLGRMKEALGDCLMAANIDPVFLKAQVRAAHLTLQWEKLKMLKISIQNAWNREPITPWTGK
ncbi:dnaJ domain, Tetratricopeptide-like helical domain protein [Artemisia annua]|uniref:DnaJ domain, Tetratricopeptide-like helical domain protein n=1 Tax=Artemisia annua TaxID=35608 RepID=A0A2U1KG72_ARTAN|nr:dnaJ domain, Tetratricopeptide-like helical domain protein [Artemisia annua]